MIEAAHLSKRDLFGLSDPFTQVKCGDKSFETQVSSWDWLEDQDLLDSMQSPQHKIDILDNWGYCCWLFDGYCCCCCCSIVCAAFLQSGLPTVRKMWKYRILYFTSVLEPQEALFAHLTPCKAKSLCWTLLCGSKACSFRNKALLRLPALAFWWFC